MKKARRFRRHFCFHKFLHNQAPAYLYSLLPPPNKHYNHVTIPKLDRSSAEQKLLVILFCLRQLENRAYLIPQFVKLLHIQYFATHFQTLFDRLQIDGFSHLREHKFKHNFQDTLSPLCPSSLEAEDTYHFFMRYQNFSN